MALDWTDHHREAMQAGGYAVIRGLLNAADCRGLVRLFDEPAAFRKRVVMARHNFGEGEYGYLGEPLPPIVGQLRERLYVLLTPVANEWARRLKIGTGYPPDLATYLDRCRESGQLLPTPLLLRYQAGGYNRLHQDLYGPQCFPLQVTVLLSRPGADFTGGEFVLTEQRPRTQPRATVIPLERGDAVAFASHQRPEPGVRGDRRVSVRHGVSTVTRGARTTLGVIFHNAR